MNKISVIFRQKNFHLPKKPMLAKIFVFKAVCFFWRTELMPRSQDNLLHMANALLANSFIFHYYYLNSKQHSDKE